MSGAGRPADGARFDGPGRSRAVPGRGTRRRGGRRAARGSRAAEEAAAPVMAPTVSAN